MVTPGIYCNESTNSKICLFSIESAPIYSMLGISCLATFGVFVATTMVGLSSIVSSISSDFKFDMSKLKESVI